MRKIIVSTFVTLDGVMEAPGGEPGHPHTGWVGGYMGPEEVQYRPTRRTRRNRCWWDG